MTEWLSNAGIPMWAFILVIVIIILLIIVIPIVKGYKAEMRKGSDSKKSSSKSKSSKK